MSFLGMQVFQICDIVWEIHYKIVWQEVMTGHGFEKTKKCMEMKVFAKNVHFSNGLVCTDCNKNARTHELHLLWLLLWDIENRNKRKFESFRDVSILIFWKITAQKMKFSIKDFFSKCDQIRMENFIFCAVNVRYRGVFRTLSNI